MSQSHPSFRLLADSSDVLFWDALELYVESFPRDEREPLGNVAAVASGKPPPFSPTAGLTFRAAIAEFNDQLAGFSYFVCDDESQIGYLVFLVIDERFRRMGLGRQLFDYVVSQISSHFTLRQGQLQALLFECERPELADGDVKSRREARISFFTTLGARVLSRAYTQLSLGPGRNPVPLYLMVYGVANGVDLVRTVELFHRRFWGLAPGSFEEMSTLKAMESSGPHWD